MLTQPTVVSADHVQSRSVVTTSSPAPPVAGNERCGAFAVTSHFVLLGVTTDDCDDVPRPENRATATMTTVLRVTSITINWQTIDCRSNGPAIEIRSRL